MIRRFVQDIVSDEWLYLFNIYGFNQNFIYMDVCPFGGISAFHRSRFYKICCHLFIGILRTNWYIWSAQSNALGFIDVTFFSPL